MSVWTPRVLSTVYRHRLQTLYDLLLQLLSNSSTSLDGANREVFSTFTVSISLQTPRQLQIEAERKLTREGDPLEYITFLKNSYAIMSETAPTVGRNSFEQRWTQQQIVDRVIELQFRQEEKPSHVLCSGYRKLRPSVSGSGSARRRAPQGLECVCENSSVEIVNSDNWRILLSRIGDLVMLHLLSHAAIFMPLLNGCYLQISGVPISNSVSLCRKSPPLHSGEKMLRNSIKRRSSSETYSAVREQNDRGSNPNWRIEEGNNLDHSADKVRSESAMAAEEFLQSSAKNSKSDDELFQTRGLDKTLTSPYQSDVDYHNGVSSQTFNVSSILSPNIERSSSYQKSMKLEPSSFDKLSPRNNSNQVKRNPAKKKKKSRATTSRHVNGCILGNDTKNEHRPRVCPPILNITVDTDLKPVGVNHHCRGKRKDSGGRQYVDTDIPPTIPSNVAEANKSTASGSSNLSNQRVVTGSGPNCEKPSKRTKREETNLVLNLVCQQRKPFNFDPDLAGHEVGYVPVLIGRTVLKHGSNWSTKCSSVLPDASYCPQSSDSCYHERKTRPSSWKRRKMQQTFPELQTQDLLETSKTNSQSESANTLKLQEPREEDLTVEAGDEYRKALKSLPQESQYSGTERCNSGAGTAGRAQAILGPSPVGPPVISNRSSHSRKGKSDPQGKPSGPSHMQIDRAQIFYNSDFSTHPGLPTKHILNTTKASDIGVAHLFSDIFVPGNKIHLWSSSHNNLEAKSTRFVCKLLKKLLANARRCSFARLLSRHCPLPHDLRTSSGDSPLMSMETSAANSSPSALVASTSHEPQPQPLNISPSEESPEVEEIMRLWLGSQYLPRITEATEPLDSVNISGRDAFSFSGELGGASSSRVVDEGHKQVQTSEHDGVATGVAGKASQAVLISSYTNHSSVVGFLWAVCRSIVPEDMFGSLRSWRSLRGSIAHFVSLRRHEKFSVQHALFRLKVSSFQWLTFPSDIEKGTNFSKVGDERGLQQKRLALWLYWLFTNLVVPLIRTHFYVTENESYRQNVFYYRKPVWAKIRHSALKELTTRNYRKMTKKSVAEALDRKVLGFSQIRLLPKRTGVRPIANLAASSQGTLKFRVKPDRAVALRQGSKCCGEILVLNSADQNDNTKMGNHRLLHQSKFLSSNNYSEDKGRLFDKKSTVSIPSSVDPADCFPDKAGSRGSSGPTTTCKGSNPPKTHNQRGCWRSVNYSFKSTNYVLRDAYYCLKLEKNSRPEDLGSSVFGYSDIHAKVIPFILQMKGSCEGMPRLYMAVCDVSKAYDTIQQERLQEIVDQFVRSSHYNVAKFTCVTPTLASVRVSHGRAPTRADEHQNFLDLMDDLASKHSHCVFTDHALRTNVRREQVLAMVTEHVKHNIVQIGTHFYHQTMGIPQGSILSSLLCSLFYGHFDVHSFIPHLQSRFKETSYFLEHHPTRFTHETPKEITACELQLPLSEALAAESTECEVESLLESSFKIHVTPQERLLEKPVTLSHSQEGYPDFGNAEFQRPSSITTVSRAQGPYSKNSILLRLIDDSFFISTSQAAATVFVQSMHVGSEEYGCHANQRKTAASFSLRVGDNFLPKNVYETEDGACFMRWSGLLINCYTVEFQADYTRYCGEHIKSTLTVRKERNQGWQLVLKMCQYMRPKCHALFFDPRINSPATIRLNAFQAFLLCAMKLHSYISCMVPVKGDNQPFLYKVIGCTTRYMYDLIRHKMETVGAKAADYFPFEELEWLALVGFHRILKRKQSRYQVLLRVLQSQLQGQMYKKLESCPHLSSAIDERRSSMFKFIKY